MRRSREALDRWRTEQIERNKRYRRTITALQAQLRRRCSTEETAAIRKETQRRNRRIRELEREVADAREVRAQNRALAKLCQRQRETIAELLGPVGPPEPEVLERAA